MKDVDAPLLLDRLFRRHPESTRMMAVVHHVDGMTLDQVARECGMSVSGLGWSFGGR
jgi:RNA polymerase sigma-70 factor (ECF subfamily)